MLFLGGAYLLGGLLIFWRGCLQVWGGCSGGVDYVFFWGGGDGFLSGASIVLGGASASPGKHEFEVQKVPKVPHYTGALPVLCAIARLPQRDSHIPPCKMEYPSNTCTIPHEIEEERMRNHLCNTISKRYWHCIARLLRLTFPRAKLRRQIVMTRAEVWAKNWANFSAHFRASFAVQNDPQIFSPNSSQFITPCLVAEV